MKGGQNSCAGGPELPWPYLCVCGVSCLSKEKLVIEAEAGSFLGTLEFSFHTYSLLNDLRSVFVIRTNLLSLAFQLQMQHRVHESSWRS